VEHNVTPTQLAKKTGLARSTVYLALTDKKVSLDVLERIAKAIGVTLTEVRGQP